MRELTKIFGCIVVVCTLYIFCVQKDFKLGCIFVLILFIFEVLEYKKTKIKVGVIVAGILLLFCLTVAYIL